MLASEFLLDFHSPSHRFKGGKPGKFSDFISAAESAGWRELGCFRGLGKIWDKSGFFLIGWVWPIRPDFVGVNQMTKVSNSDQLFYCAYAIMTLETHPSLLQVL